ncbi:MAG: nucleoside triphosphate pyrophosphohydrolase [Prevotella sp.]|nr:nucleoside triphosphate pyrophosphohydrolase [Prevotella sp.]
MLDVLETLRQQCPWDKKQTNESLRPNTIEETFELCDALMRGDTEEEQKELGDVLMHVCFYASIAQQQGQFDIADVCNALVDKLIYRHPHVYHPSQVGQAKPVPLSDMNSDERDELSVTKVLENWEQLKVREKGGNKTVLSGVPAALPSLIKAYRIQDKARNVGFDWEERRDVWHKVDEERHELQQELDRLDRLPETATTEEKAEARRMAEAELGDYLFSVINAARLYHLNPDNALEHTNQKFISRFNYVEQHSIRAGKPLTEMSLDEMDRLWDEAKQQERR